MTMEKLKFINRGLKSVGVPYEYGMWSSEVQYPYFVGEITEEEPTTEDGFTESTLTLEGFHRGEYIELERVKDKIRSYFHPIEGVSGETEGGGVVVAFYAGAFPIPDDGSGVKRIRINIKIKEWKVI